MSPRAIINFTPDVIYVATVKELLNFSKITIIAIIERWISKLSTLADFCANKPALIILIWTLQDILHQLTKDSVDVLFKRDEILSLMGQWDFTTFCNLKLNF